LIDCPQLVTTWAKLSTDKATETTTQPALLPYPHCLLLLPNETDNRPAILAGTVQFAMKKATKTASDAVEEGKEMTIRSNKLSLSDNMCGWMLADICST
jgi:hypothetical protein